MTDDPHQFTRDAWEANAEVWDARMGDEGNDFFNKKCAPSAVHYPMVGGTRQRHSDGSSFKPRKLSENAAPTHQSVHAVLGV